MTVLVGHSFYASRLFLLGQFGYDLTGSIATSYARRYGLTSSLHHLTGSTSVTGLTRRLQRQQLVARELILSDSEWFARNPQALVRFRPERQADFGLLTLQGLEAPSFIPEGLDTAAPLNWIAVVDVLRALDIPETACDGSLRARIRTVPIRSRRLKAQMAEVFAIAVCRDVLAEFECQLPAQSELA